MKDSDIQRIEHIKSYCTDIRNTINRFGDSYEVFEKDVDYQNSISMSLLQIGELAEVYPTNLRIVPEIRCNGGRSEA